MNPIELRDLKRDFGATQALKGVSLEVKERELFALLGPDGAGKSTLCRILAGILDAQGGEARLKDLDIAKNSEKIKDFIGYMPQNFALYPDLTVAENIDFYADLYGVNQKERKSRMNRLMEITNLAPFTSRYAGNLSGGMKQKLTLSACLIHTPEILILDEPTLGVDPVSRREFWKLLYDLLKEGVTILVATSYMDEAERCNRLAVLNRGEVIASGSPQEVKELVPGRILEVETPDAVEGLRVARSLPQALLATTFGDNLRILLGESVSREDTLRQLQAGGVEIDSAREFPPSIEDAFIYLVQQKEGNHHGGK